MQSSRFIFFFKIWAIVFATTLYFAQASIAQSPEPRLIRPLRRGSGAYHNKKLLSHDFVVYGRAKEPIGAGIAAPR